MSDRDASSKVGVVFSIIGLLLPVIYACLLLIGTGNAERQNQVRIEEWNAQATTTIIIAATALPSSYETGVITSVVPLLTAGQGEGLKYLAVELYFDGKWLWLSLADRLVALDPEAREIVVGPIQLDQAAGDMLFDGQQLWISQLTDREGEYFHGYYRKRLHTVDLATGRVGPAVEAPIWSGSPLVSDGQRLWFIAIDGADKFDQGKFVLQSVDARSRELSPQIETGTRPWQLFADKTRQVLWLIDTDGQLQQYDLRQNALRNTAWQVDDLAVTSSAVYFDGQRLWIVDHGPNTFQSLDVDTGKKTVGTAPVKPYSGEVRAASSVLGNEVIWFSTGGREIIQAFDTATNQIGPIIPTSGHPGDLAFDGQRLWMVLNGNPLGIGDFVGLQYIVPKE